MHYTALGLHDGTILVAYPVRKPHPKTIKNDKIRIDEDGVCHEYPSAGGHLSDVHNETRMRLQNIVATRLNTRRAIREMVLPCLIKLQSDINEIRDQLDQIQRLLSDKRETKDFKASKSTGHIT